MKKYKLLKDLPGVKAGEIIEVKSEPESATDIGIVTFYTRELDDNPDFFQLIEEPKIFLRTEDGKDIYLGDDLWLIIGCIAKEFVWDIKKPDWTAEDRINSLSHNKFFSSLEAANSYIESLKPKVVFTTEDDYEVKEGEKVEFHLIDINEKIDNAYEIHKTESFNKNPTPKYKWFHSKDKAREYLVNNYPFFSIEHVWSMGGYSRLKEIAEDKAKQIIS